MMISIVGVLLIGQTFAQSTTTTVASTTTAGSATVTTTTDSSFCTATTASFNSAGRSKVLRTWKALEMDCPKQGDKPKVALVSFNMGGTKNREAVQISMAASSSSGATGLAASMGKSTSTTPDSGTFVGKASNGLCSGALDSKDKVCHASSLNAAGGSAQTKYISVWNTGGCTGKVTVEASISEFDADQKSSCSSNLVEVGGPRSGNPDDLYCNIGYASSCTSSYSDILCGSIKAGYQCMAIKTTQTTTLFGFSSTCTKNAMTCQPKGEACAIQKSSVGDKSEDCVVCNSNDCMGSEVLKPTSEGGMNKVAMPILAFAITASLIFS